MTIPSLPIELFELICSHVQDHANLFSLLLTSRAFNHGAEKVLYRNVDLIGHRKATTRHVMVLSHLASCKRVAAFVKSIDLIPHRFPKEKIRDALRLTVNLTSLSIQYENRFQRDYLLSDLTNATSFKLKSLNIYRYYQQDLEDFLHSQRQISSILWRPHTAHNYPPISDFSNITTLDSTPEFLEYILPHCQPRRLHLRRVSIQRPIPSLEVFSSHDPNVASQLLIATLFPNLRFLEACLFSEVQLQQYLQISLPPRIEVLRILLCSAVSSQTMFDHAQRVFENNLNMSHVEIGCDLDLGGVSGVKVRLLEDKNQKCSETFCIGDWDWTEWKTW